MQKQVFNLGPRPRGASQELEARGNAWVDGETAHLDLPSQLLKPQLINQPRNHHLESDAVERIVGLSHDRIAAKVVGLYLQNRPKNRR